MKRSSETTTWWLNASDEAQDRSFIATITVLIAEGGPGTMVLGAYEKHVAGPRREAIKKAQLAEEQKNAMKAWNQRRLQAQANDEPFDEPFPDDDNSQ